ncbi:MAG: DMT family transporter [Rubrivivax sp.]|nr:DMT family transporter [Rubrivivax sp.]MDP3615686.1 DMT family transporter [Rubrivivax sp.]
MLKTDSARSRRIGIGLVTLATFCFAILDACAKWLVQTLPVVEVVWLRFVTHVLLMVLLLAPAHGRALVRMHSPRLHLLRAAMLASMTGLNFWALQYLQLAETGAIQFSVPMLIALLSAWWLHEKLDLRRWVAIVGGFAGVLLVIRPGSQAFHPAILLCVGNALLYAAFNLLTRRMVATESPQAMQLLSAVGAALVLAPPALLHWQAPPDTLHWGVIALCGLMGGVGHLAVALAHRYASAAVLGPFLYQQILYMALWGWLVFSQVPDAYVVAGALVVVASGLYLLWLEMRKA